MATYDNTAKNHLSLWCLVVKAVIDVLFLKVIELLCVMDRPDVLSVIDLSDFCKGFDVQNVL